LGKDLSSWLCNCFSGRACDRTIIGWSPQRSYIDRRSRGIAIFFQEPNASLFETFLLSTFLHCSVFGGVLLTLQFAICMPVGGLLGFNCCLTSEATCKATSAVTDVIHDGRPDKDEKHVWETHQIS